MYKVQIHCVLPYIPSAQCNNLFIIIDTIIISVLVYLTASNCLQSKGLKNQIISQIETLYHAKIKYANCG